ncbi:hypothetical protein A2U01_0069202 [Trifolium medium]|uniref:Uncharacterized protein n=1 Tax=Trifolium medium TaxID=97028 RepID=A0A392SJ59_9FABA|nr:hypothetical protein [Trifolium medium]
MMAFTARQQYNSSLRNSKLNAIAARRREEQAAAEAMERELFSDAGFDLNMTSSFTDFMSTDPPAES